MKHYKTYNSQGQVKVGVEPYLPYKASCHKSQCRALMDIIFVADINPGCEIEVSSFPALSVLHPDCCWENHIGSGY